MSKWILWTLLLTLCGHEVTALWGSQNKACESPCVPGDESIMRPKAHGTSETPVQDNLQWDCDRDLADRFVVACGVRIGLHLTTKVLLTIDDFLFFP
jgi:hypothetical protein